MRMLGGQPLYEARIPLALRAGTLGLAISAAFVLVADLRAQTVSQKPDASAKRLAELDALLARCETLIDENKSRDAYAILINLRNRVGKHTQPRVEAMLAHLALMEKRPDLAMPFIEPWTTPPKDSEKYDQDQFDVWLASGYVLLETEGKARDALRIFDWLAKNNQEGNDRLIKAAVGAGNAFIAVRDYEQAIYSFQFAIRYGKACSLSPDLLKKLLGPAHEGIERAKHLRDIELYGEDFLLYRQAEQLRRERKDYARARETYLHCIEVAQKNMTELIARQDKAQQGDTALHKQAGASGLKIAGKQEQIPLSPYAEASTLYAALCLPHIEPRSANIALAEKELWDFYQSDKTGKGLYRGEALLELGRIALEYRVSLSNAEKYFKLLDEWITRVRNEQQATGSTTHTTDLPGIKPAAQPRVAPPKSEYAKADFWGNINRTGIEPGQLVNQRTCSWYLNDLAENCYKFLGFLRFVDGKKEAALAYYEKILGLDPRISDGNIESNPNDFTRLKWGAEHGYLSAYPEELRLYDGQLRLAVLLGDFYFCTERFAQARGIYQRLLDNEFGRLSSAQRDYVLWAVAECIYWTKGRKEAFPAFLEVLKVRDGTYTEDRAAYSAGNIGVHVDDPVIHAKAREILAGLAKKQPANDWTWQARLMYAVDVYKSGDRDQGKEILRDFPKTAGDYQAFADYLLAEFEKSEQDTQP
jgi:hypothetical protein